VAKMCDSVAVMYAGKIVEKSPVRDLFTHPQHPYTKALLGSVPRLGNKDPLFAIPGQPPNLADLPAGCPFQPRCASALQRCTTEEPREVHLDETWTVRCWLPELTNGGYHDNATP
jgi:oligopeptide/dipeptide ABC transporter ATP-binding protein